MVRAAVVLITALVLATPAQAKGPVSVDVCGASGCETLGPFPAHGALFSGVASALLNHGDGELDLAEMPPPGPFYTLDLRAGWLDDLDPSFYVPEARALRFGGSWLRLDRSAVSDFRTATEGIEPWPWLGLRSVRLGRHEAARPAPYDVLFRRLTSADPPPYTAERISVVAEPNRLERPEYAGTPWTDPRVIIEWVPSHSVVYRDGAWFRVPPGLGEQLARDAGLAPSAPAESISSEPWALVAGAIAGCVLAVAAGIALAVRVRRRVRAAV
jgi:hypothetical protein